MNVKYFLITAAVVIAIAGGLLVKNAYDAQAHPAETKKVTTSFNDFWKSLPVVDANENKATK